jgi:hypothetical protein
MFLASEMNRAGLLGWLFWIILLSLLVFGILTLVIRTPDDNSSEQNSESLQTIENETVPFYENRTSGLNMAEFQTGQ